MNSTSSSSSPQHLQKLIRSLSSSSSTLASLFAPQRIHMNLTQHKYIFIHGMHLRVNANLFFYLQISQIYSSLFYIHKMHHHISSISARQRVSFFFFINLLFFFLGSKEYTQTQAHTIDVKKKRITWKKWNFQLQSRQCSSQGFTSCLLQNFVFVYYTYSFSPKLVLLRQN